MKRLFPLPLYTFLKIAFENGGISAKGLKNLPPWLIKTILFEPLRWVEMATQNRAINRHSIKNDPIFILGYYRSGTSYLHDFLKQDDRLGYHSVFQMVLPEIMLTCERWLAPVLQFISRVFKLQDRVHRIPLDWEYPGEEDATMTTSLNPRGAQWGYFFPKMMNKQFNKYVLFENIPDPEKEAWKQDLIFLLKKISLANQNKQLVLKSPPQTARISLLLSLYPNAKFIFIHRNPYEVYLSNKHFWKVTRSIYALGGIGSIDVNAVILDTYSKITDRYLKEKALVPEGQLVEVPYEDLIQHPMESIRKIYEAVHIGEFSHCENKMKVFVDRQRNFVRLKHEIPADERKQVSQVLEPYVKYWNYPVS
jgi:hypothetical protein